MKVSTAVFLVVSFLILDPCWAENTPAIQLRSVSPKPPEAIPSKVSFDTLGQAEKIQRYAAWLKSRMSENVLSAEGKYFQGYASVTMEKYLKAQIELLNYLKTDADVIMTIILIYIKRLQENTALSIRVDTYARMLLSCMLLALKFYDDWGIKNSQYATLTGMKVEDIKKLELITLHLLDFRLNFTQEEYEALQRELMETVLPAA